MYEVPYTVLLVLENCRGIKGLEVRINYMRTREIIVKRISIPYNMLYKVSIIHYAHQDISNILYSTYIVHTRYIIYIYIYISCVYSVCVSI